MATIDIRRGPTWGPVPASVREMIAAELGCCATGDGRTPWQGGLCDSCWINEGLVAAEVVANARILLGIDWRLA